MSETDAATALGGRLAALVDLQCTFDHVRRLTAGHDGPSREDWLDTLAVQVRGLADQVAARMLAVDAVPVTTPQAVVTYRPLPDYAVRGRSFADHQAALGTHTARVAQDHTDGALLLEAADGPSAALLRRQAEDIEGIAAALEHGGPDGEEDPSVHEVLSLGD